MTTESYQENSEYDQFLQPRLFLQRKEKPAKKQISEKLMSNENQEISRAKPNQRLLLHKSLFKNLHLIVVSYLQSNEICQLTKCHAGFRTLLNDSFFYQTLVNTQMASLYLNQFIKPR